jgi:Putative auto-transporter adhesin, head GIN domain
MKYFITFAIFILFGKVSLQAQLLGSGKVVSRNYAFKNFNKLNIEDFDGKIEVEIGSEYSINLKIDDNLEPMFRILLDESEQLLKIYLDKNKNGRLYLEDTNIKISITMPEASVISHRGNTKLTVSGILGRYFRLENTGNGDVYLQGKVDKLDIKKTGNGDVKANKLEAKWVNVKNNGNGNVVVNAVVSLTANGVGNGSVIQFGKGDIEPLSGIIGNGDVRRN